MKTKTATKLTLATKKERLAELSAEIREASDQASDLLARGADRARRVGLLLAEAKTLLPHGEFLPWVKKETGLSPVQSQKYMKFITLPEANASSGTHFNLHAALGHRTKTRRDHLDDEARDDRELAEAKKLMGEKYGLPPHEQARVTALDAVAPEHRKLALRLVAVGYKHLSKKAHPDKGGSTDQFNALTSAKEWAEQLLGGGR